jgi:Glycosyltransferase family 87
LRRIIELPRTVAVAIQQQFWAVAHQTERTLLLGTILLGTAVSGAIGFVLTQYYSVDVTTSLIGEARDCGPESRMRIGVHCFSDYPVTETVAMRPNPWDPIWQPLGIGGPAYQPLRIEYPAAGMVPHLLLGSLGKWFDAPELGLVITLAALTIAVFAPAMWAARGARGLERIVVFVACGAAAVPAWVVIDRGNVVGLLAPIALGFLVALCRRRWGLVAIGVVLAALVKPQYAILVVVLFAARRWRLGGAAAAGVIVTNVVAYLLWPRDFPGTIGQSIHNLFGYTWWGPIGTWRNVSFANGLYYSVRKAIRVLTGQGIPEGFINPAESVVGYAILVVVVGSVLVLGRRIDPVMAGIALLATASLFPPLSWRYYLVFALPVAALVARDPSGPPGSGIFDRLSALGDHRRAVGICVSLAAAFSIAQIALPGPRWMIASTMTVVPTTALLVPLVWLIACAVIVVSYARRPVPRHVAATEGMEEAVPPDGAAASEVSVNQ